MFLLLALAAHADANPADPVTGTFSTDPVLLLEEPPAAAVQFVFLDQAAIDDINRRHHKLPVHINLDRLPTSNHLQSVLMMSGAQSGPGGTTLAGGPVAIYIDGSRLGEGVALPRRERDLRPGL